MHSFGVMGPGVDDRDRRLAALAANQHGIFSAADVGRLGFTRSEIQHRRASGRWVQLAPRVWRIAGAPRTWAGELCAALANLGPGALVSHRAAAALHAFDGFPEGPLELTVPRSRRGREAPWTLHTTIAMPAVDRTQVEGLATTSASRTVVDLAATDISDRRLAAAIDSAIRLGSSSPAVLRRRLSALRGSGRAGVRRLDHLLLDSGGHSPLERAFLRIVREAGLPLPRCQVVHRRGGVTFARVDFEWTELLTIVEVNGRRGHVSDAERAKDARRRNELQAEGFVVFEFTSRQVFDAPDGVLATIRPRLTGR